MIEQQRKIPRDRYGNRFYEVGDLVTRDGTDVHRVVDHNGSAGHPPDGFTVVCVKAPSQPWCAVGDEEFNTCRRYSPVGEEDEGPVVSLHEVLAAQQREFASARAEIERQVFRPMWQQVLEGVADQLAAEAARQPIGKPLSIRARRRNRGRVRAARAEIARWAVPRPVSWQWPDLGEAA